MSGGVANDPFAEVGHLHPSMTPWRSGQTRSGRVGERTMGSLPEDQLATMLANIPEKTGKPLAEWIAIIRRSSHRVRLEAIFDFDGKAKGWVKEAYSRSG